MSWSTISSSNQPLFPRSLNIDDDTTWIFSSFGNNKLSIILEKGYTSRAGPSPKQTDIQCVANVNETHALFVYDGSKPSVELYSLKLHQWFPIPATLSLANVCKCAVIGQTIVLVGEMNTLESRMETIDLQTFEMTSTNGPEKPLHCVGDFLKHTNDSLLNFHNGTIHQYNLSLREWSVRPETFWYYAPMPEAAPLFYPTVVPWTASPC